MFQPRNWWAPSPPALPTDTLTRGLAFSLQIFPQPDQWFPISSRLYGNDEGAISFWGSSRTLSSARTKTRSISAGSSLLPKKRPRFFFFEAVKGILFHALTFLRIGNFCFFWRPRLQEDSAKFVMDAKLLVLDGLKSFSPSECQISSALG